MNFPAVFVIKGPPVVKKNNRPTHRNKRTGHSFPGKSPRLVAAEKTAMNYLTEQLRFKRSFFTLPFQGPLHVKFLFYRKTRSAVDLSNLYELPQDALQKAGVIVNDKQIESHDGSRKRYDKLNPRTEIYISPFVE